MSKQEEIQRYAVHIPKSRGRKASWTILEAPIPCEAGMGEIITCGLSEDEMRRWLNAR